MNTEQYELLAMRTKKVQSTKEDLVNAAFGLCGESGKFADHMKKFIFQSHEIDYNHLKNELGDILWYIVQAAQAIGFSLEEIMTSNIDKLEKRYPDNCFNAEHSINRKE